MWIRVSDYYNLSKITKIIDCSDAQIIFKRFYNNAKLIQIHDEILIWMKI